MLRNVGYRCWVRIVACAITIVSAQAMAAPSSDDIVTMCERALSKGFRGRTAQMCTWYVTPCDCDAGQNNVPRVCVPEDIASKTLAEQVVTLLKGLPEFRMDDGAKAVAQVLAVRYPCDNNFEP